MSTVAAATLVVARVGRNTCIGGRRPEGDDCRCELGARKLDRDDFGAAGLKSLLQRATWVEPGGERTQLCFQIAKHTACRLRGLFEVFKRLVRCKRHPRPLRGLDRASRYRRIFGSDVCIAAVRRGAWVRHSCRARNGPRGTRREHRAGCACHHVKRACTTVPGEDHADNLSHRGRRGCTFTPAFAHGA